MADRTTAAGIPFSACGRSWGWQRSWCCSSRSGASASSGSAATSSPAPTRPRPSQGRSASPAASASASAQPAARRAEPEPTRRQGPTRHDQRPAEERKPVDINPAPARPRPRALPPGRRVHDGHLQRPRQLAHQAAAATPPGMARARSASAAPCAARPAPVSVVGFQEFQPDQRARSSARAPGWAMYPGPDAWAARRRELGRLAHRHLGAGQARPGPDPLLQRPHPADALRAAAQQGDRRPGLLLHLPQPGRTSAATTSAVPRRGHHAARSSCSTSSRRPASRSSSPAT